MLIELRIQGYTVIDDQSLQLGPGLNVLTGETGAGKSIIVGALSLLLGERASAEVVRAGEDRAAVEAVFEIGGREALEEKLAVSGFQTSDGLLILKREVQREGRNRAWVNGSPTTARIVWELGGALVDLHGQHEHQHLLRRASQRAVLDAYAGATPRVEQLRSLHGVTKALSARLEERRSELRELEARSDFLRFQLGEIEGARLKEGEAEELQEELRRLEHSSELARGTEELHRDLYGGEHSLSDRIDQARKALTSLARFDDALEDRVEDLGAAFHLIEEIGRSLGHYAETVELDPGRLDSIRARQDELFKLKRKYGPEIEDCIRAGERLRKELDELEGGAVHLEELEDELRSKEEELDLIAGQLTARRQEAARELAEQVEAMLPALGLVDGSFAIRLDPLEEIGPVGAEGVEFQVALNRGFELRPLARVASGGELSRLMLALKSALAEADPVPTLVFDEIDAGVGGRVANAVAQKLAEVATRHQVFVITHLPQIASRADAHLRVSKTSGAGVATTVVRALSGEERIEEIARMLGGDSESERSLAHAREMMAAR